MHESRVCIFWESWKTGFIKAKNFLDFAHTFFNRFYCYQIFSKQDWKVISTEGLEKTHQGNNKDTEGSGEDKESSLPFSQSRTVREPLSWKKMTLFWTILALETQREQVVRRGMRKKRRNSKKKRGENCESDGCKRCIKWIISVAFLFPYLIHVIRRERRGLMVSLRFHNGHWVHIFSRKKKSPILQTSWQNHPAAITAITPSDTKSRNYIHKTECRSLHSL